MTAFYTRIENAEAVRLTPAMEHLRQERQGQERTIASLIVLREEKRQRLAHIESLVHEIESLEAQEARLLSETPSYARSRYFVSVLSQSERLGLRQLYAFRCGYCGITE